MRRARYEVERFRLACFEKPGCADLLADYLLRRRKVDPGRTASNRGGWQSSSDIHHADELAVIQDELLSKARATTGEQGLSIEYAWANINDAKDWGRPHVHVPFFRTIVLMVKPVAQLDEDPRDDGALLLQDYLGRVLPLEPALQAGEVIMFPGEVLHMIAPHQQSSPRITIAFNTVRTPEEVSAHSPKRVA